MLYQVVNAFSIFPEKEKGKKEKVVNACLPEESTFHQIYSLFLPHFSPPMTITYHLSISFLEFFVIFFIYMKVFFLFFYYYNNNNNNNKIKKIKKQMRKASVYIYETLMRE